MTVPSLVTVAEPHFSFADLVSTARLATSLSDSFRVCVSGGPEQVRARLSELRDLGVDQFNIYSMVDDPRAVITGFGSEIIPAFR